VTGDGKNRWLLRRPDPLVQARLFCIPYSGCGASMYRQWPLQHRGVEFCPVQLPGRENRMRDPSPETYQELAAELAEAVTPYLDVPYGFFGHCGSALTAYEACSWLERAGNRPAARLFISSQVAPQDGPAGRFLTLDDNGLTAELRTLICKLGGNPADDILELARDILRADIEVNKRYVVPAPARLAAPITTIGWTDDCEVDHRTMGGWTACGEVTLALLPGGHYRFLDCPAELLDTFAEGLVSQ
jgi:surfactin synthase thioesterase subunit